MENQKERLFEVFIYRVSRLLYLVVYYFIMVKGFNVSLFQSYYWILIIYFVICYVLHLHAIRKLRGWLDRNEEKWFLPTNTPLLSAFLLAPWIVLLVKDD